MKTNKNWFQTNLFLENHVIKIEIFKIDSSTDFMAL